MPNQTFLWYCADKKVEVFEDSLHPDLDIDTDEGLWKAKASNITDRQVEDFESNLVLKIAQMHRELAIP